VQELEVEICVTPDHALLGHVKEDAVGDVDIALGLGDQAIKPRGQGQIYLLPWTVDYVQTLYHVFRPLGLSLGQTFQEEVDAIPGIEPGHSA
jgi:hypothetical protein